MECALGSAGSSGPVEDKLRIDGGEEKGGTVYPHVSGEVGCCWDKGGFSIRGFEKIPWGDLEERARRKKRKRETYGDASSRRLACGLGTYTSNIWKVGRLEGTFTTKKHTQG